MKSHFKNNLVCQLLSIDFPIFQAGMVWCSPWRLAHAVSEFGALGTIGAGSMYPDVLDEHLSKISQATSKPFAVNLPLLYPQIDDHLELILKHKVPIVITSAGNPKTYTSFFKKHKIKVIHVVSSLKFALKAQEAGVDAIVAEGFEAGGHNGKDETTTLCLLETLFGKIQIPVIAAGGIGSGRAMLSAMVLGAQAVQIGSLFVASEESSAHMNFKEKVLQANEGDTRLTLKEITPVRLLKNAFYNKVQKAYEECATQDQLKELLGKGRAKKGMFLGDLTEGELEIGQIASVINEVKPAKDILQMLLKEYFSSLDKIKST